MPGDPGPQNSFDEALAHAERDCAAYIEGGVQTVIVENFGSAPFRRGWPSEPLEPHAIAALTRVVVRCVELGARVGVNCLRNDARAAIGIAAACGAEFVRVNVHTGAYVTDQGLIEGRAWETLRYRDALGATEVAILADVLVKHARPLTDVSLVEAARDTVHRGHADGVIVTGVATGAKADADAVDTLSGAALGVPVYVGSGVTPDNAAAYRRARGAIVGTWLKRDGDVRNLVDPVRVREMVAAWSAS